ncbi:uncharacterized protein LOC134281276, partial [Saccostrea cucullata]|uniref:uncharacterized protein LOC134281276 n=1 Tax=Saccostrea cuccullata TaxID=36930 RepID=UPI002ED3BA98
EFHANSDSTTLVRNDLPFPVNARYLRLYPTDCHDYCSLRFDVLGCEVTPLSTAMMSTATMRTTAGVKIATEISTTTSTDTWSTTWTQVPTTTSEQMSTTTSTQNLMSTTTVSSTIVSPCPCTCIKKHNTTLTESELLARLAVIVQNLTISKKTTSIYRRSKISAQDNRPQALYVGSVGIAILFIVVNLIVLPDLLKLFHYLYVTHRILLNFELIVTNCRTIFNIAYACNDHLVETVTDDKLTVSSIFDKDYLPQYARLSHTFGWSPNEKESNPWIQMGVIHMIPNQEITRKKI